MKYPIRIKNAVGVNHVRNDTILLAEEAGDNLPGRALDLGCGNGYVGIFLAKNGWQVDTVDISRRALALTRHNAKLNEVDIRVFHSNLFSAVQGTYDVIAFNPPVRADETDFSRQLTSTLRWFGYLTDLLMRINQLFWKRSRMDFLVKVARMAQPYLSMNGKLILVISPLEERELPGLVEGLIIDHRVTVKSISVNVVTFYYASY